MSKKSRIRIDAPPVTEDEALELMVHHLQLAAAYYEATSDDDDQVSKEMTRLMSDASSHITGYVGPALTSAKAWLKTIKLYYENIKLADEVDEEKKPN